MQPTFFPNASSFRKWLSKNHKKEKELLVGFYTVKSGRPSITWSESVDQALCFGWIDGVRKNINEESYSIRFTPRKPTSIWSLVNIKKMEALTAQGLVQPAGLDAYAKKTEHKSGIYAFENEKKELKPAYKKKFKANKKAWLFFSEQPPYYQKLSVHRIMTAKQEKTQLSRLENIIKASEEGRRIL